MRAAQRSLLTALAGPGYADDAELRARITALGVPLAGRQLLPIAALADSPADQDDGAGALADALTGASQASGLPALASALDDRRAVALLALPTGTDPDDVLARLAGQVSASGPIGAGPLAATLTEARAGLDAAIQAAEAAGTAGISGGSGRPFVRLGDLRLAGLAYQLRDDPRVLAFAERELGPLLRHDAKAGTDLTGLLASYLDSGGNKAAAAHRAGLSRPTLYDRVGQIEQILGVGLDSAESRLALHAALLVHRISTSSA